MIHPREIDHVVLRVVDVERAVRFYTEVLGCTVEKLQLKIGLHQLRAGRSLVDLVRVDSPLGEVGGAAPGAAAHNMDHFCLRLDPFDGEAILRWLDEHGVEHSEIGSRYGAEGEGPSIYVKDPDGNTVELKGPPWPQQSGASPAAT